jgi:type VI secretion system secreted protein Hcp
MKRFILAVVAACLAMFPAAASAGLNSYLRVTGETQGQIDGGVTQAGREDTIEVLSFSHGIEAPIDGATGMATGVREHEPLVVTTKLEESTPLLLNALANNENIVEFRLEMWEPSRSGKELQYYTIELQNASVAFIEINSGEERTDPHTATIGFSYQTITHTYEDGGITGQDNWAPVTP